MNNEIGSERQTRERQARRAPLRVGEPLPARSLRAALALTLAFVIGAAPPAVIGGHQQASVASYTGCLSPGGDLTDLAEGDVPKAECKGNKTEVHLSGGDITAVLAGTGLTGGGAEGSTSLAVDTRTTQARVSGSCAVGSSIREVAQDGSVTCEPDDLGLAYNPLQVALLRWYDGAQGRSVDVGDGPIGVAFDGDHIWVANNGSDTVTVRRASDGGFRALLATGSEPYALAFDGRLMWVTNLGNDTVVPCDVSSCATTFAVPVGHDPRGIVYDGRSIWVTNSGDGTVTAFDVGAPSLNLRTVDVGNHPEGIAFDGANLWVANFGDGTVTKVRASDGTVLDTIAGFVGPVAVAFDGVNVWVTDANGGRASRLRTSDGAILTTVPVGANPVAVAFDGISIWVANHDDDSVTRLVAADGTNLGSFHVGGSPFGVAFDGANIWVTNSADDSVSKL